MLNSTDQTDVSLRHALMLVVRLVAAACYPAIKACFLRRHPAFSRACRVGADDSHLVLGAPEMVRRNVVALPVSGSCLWDRDRRGNIRRKHPLRRCCTLALETRGFSRRTEIFELAPRPLRYFFRGSSAGFT